MEINKKIFKKNDIRGIYPSEINGDVVYKIATELANNLFKKGIVITARDTRIGSPKLYKSLIKGLKSNPDIKIVPLGLSTTPMFYFLVVKLKAAGGIMITASHNPKEYNGLKVVTKGAEMVGGEKIQTMLKIK